MRSKLKNPISRRDFLKGLGLAGSGALLTFLGGHEAREVQASTPERKLGTAPQGINDPPPPISSFLLEVSGLPLSVTFDNCTNFGIETNIIFEKGDETIVRTRPELITQYRNILLERELTTDMEMWDWFEAVRNGSDFRFNASLTALDDTFTAVAQWNLINCWPSEVYAMLSRTGTGPYTPLMRERTVLAIETLERVA